MRIVETGLSDTLADSSTSTKFSEFSIEGQTNLNCINSTQEWLLLTSINVD